MVSFGDVDRRERMLLPRVFKVLQDAAIAHANQFGTGTEAMTTRGETWMLHRIAAKIARYPRPNEVLQVETWSNGIKGFKGIRDFRVRDAEQRLVVAASSVWLYVSVQKQSIVRVPAEIARNFPVCPEALSFAEIESLEFALPAAGAPVVTLDLRYSDFDVNQHVNNAAYLEFVQTALTRTGHNPYPHEVRVKFGKAIPGDADRVDVRVDAAPEGVNRLSVEREGVIFAQLETAGVARD